VNANPRRLIADRQRLQAQIKDWDEVIKTATAERAKCSLEALAVEQEIDAITPEVGELRDAIWGSFQTHMLMIADLGEWREMPGLANRFVIASVSFTWLWVASDQGRIVIRDEHDRRLLHHCLTFAYAP
jgi:hypothetical protein